MVFNALVDIRSELADQWDKMEELEGRINKIPLEGPNKGSN
jgi:hypothetical protein